MQAILSFIRKELLQVRRDRQMIPLLFLAPIIQLGLFGYAVATNIRNITTAVHDEDNSAESRAFIRAYEQSGYFLIKRYVTDPKEMESLIETGHAKLGIHIPRNFSEHQKRRETAPVQFLLDGSDSNTAAVIMGYAVAIAQRTALNIAAEWLGGVQTAIPSVDLRSRVWYNPDLDAVNFIIPGIICTILTVVTTTLCASAIVREKERGTIEQLLVSPISRTQFILGKLLPFLIIGYMDVILILTVGMLWFGVPCRGSIVLLFALAIPFIMNTLGIGLLISTVATSQQQASLAVNFLMTPWMLLSGFMFPIENMPHAIQWLTYTIPLRYFLIIIRGIMLRGLGFMELWQQWIPLTALGILTLTTAVLRFNKRVA